MNKKGATLGGIVFMIIGVIVCLALFGVIVDRQNEATSKFVVVNETRDLTACYGDEADTGVFQVNESIAACNFTVGSWYPSGDWRASHSQCEIGAVGISNGTDTDFAVNTDYVVWAGTGIIQFLNTTGVTGTENSAGNDTFFTYDRCGEGYNTSSGARGVAGLWTIFAALIIFSVVVFYGIKNEWFLSLN